MSIGQRRFILNASLVFVVAFALGLGDLLTDAPQPPRPRPDTRAQAPRKSGDDAGFSIALTQPTDPFLVGRQTIAVEAEVPAGDRILQVDFFVDGRLVDTDRQAPYAITFDFGSDIRRHTLVVTALTGGGRRAKVSFVSRAARVDGDPERPMVVVPAVVRDAAGRLVDGLSVSDFTVLENGERQAILHFDHTPAPLSIGVVLHAPDPVASARGPLLRQAALLADDLPPYHALAFLDAPRAGAGAPPPAGRAAQASLIASAAPTRRSAEPALPDLGFTYDRARFVQRLAEAAGIRPAANRQLSLADAFAAAARALADEPRGRVLVALVASSPGSGTCPVLAAETPGGAAADEGAGETPEDAPPAGIEPAGDADATGGGPGPAADAGPSPAPEPVDAALAGALEALKMAGVTLHVLAVGEAEGGLFEALRKATDESGGEFLEARSQAGLEAFSRLLAETLAGQYLISYRPPHPERAGWRTLKMRVRPPDLVVRVRDAYYQAPPEEPEPPARAAGPRPAARAGAAAGPAGAAAGPAGRQPGEATRPAPEEEDAAAPAPDEDTETAPPPPDGR